MAWTLHEGDCLEVLKTLPEASVDAVITDPPYAEIDRQYGRWTEAEWWELMMGVCREVRRILKPTGSAVFVLQANSRKVGSMRGWLWEFMAWVCREWNMVQDVWWWNHTKQPTVHCSRANGLTRPSVKAMVWCGQPRCYRDQDSVLWESSMDNVADRAATRALEYQTSGGSMRRQRCAMASSERGGVTPFNLLPLANADSSSSAGAHGHGAGTPLTLMRWWTRYICPPGGTVLDPFAGSGTTGIACEMEGRDSILIERVPEYCGIIRKRLSGLDASAPLFQRVK